MAPRNDRTSDNIPQAKSSLPPRSEEHTSELQHANISYAVFCSALVFHLLPTRRSSDLAARRQGPCRPPRSRRQKRTTGRISCPPSLTLKTERRASVHLSDGSEKRSDIGQYSAGEIFATPEIGRAHV